MAGYMYPISLAVLSGFVMPLECLFPWRPEQKQLRPKLWSDFNQWCVHNMLHRVPLFWEFHKAHHSVKDAEMDWSVSFRFSWPEVIVYKSVLYLPMAFFGCRWEALMFHAIFGTAKMPVAWYFSQHH